MARPTNADSAETLEKIRGAALSLLDEHGPDAVSFRRVAGQAGVSVGTVRYYFATREALLEACLDSYQDTLRDLEEQWAMMLTAAEDLPGTIAMTASAAFDLLIGQQELTRLRLLSSVKQGGLQQGRRKTARDPFMRRAVGILATRTGRPTLEVRLAVDALSRLISWYATLDDDEKLDVTETEDADAANAIIRAHVGKTAQMLLTARPA